MSLTLLGVRHHGPGCARSVVAALEALRPAVVLIEGPPDADEVIVSAALAGMEPPVALLVYRADNARQAVFYPFAEFSPEWQTIRWALKNSVPVRFMDFPWAHRFALQEEQGAKKNAAEPAEQQQQEQESESDGAVAPTEKPDDAIRGDPLAWLAKADGYSDSERWWNDRVEERADPAGMFTAILEAMTAVRTELAMPEKLEEQRREAWMRRMIRETHRETLGAIAVVCGAWHAPALADPPKISADNELLKNLPKCKTAATWVPRTYQRLCFASGYGAGIASPGWYEHLWRHRSDAQITARWLACVSRVLRGRDLDASTAQVIDGVRLAEHLAAFRGRPIPGLPELNEAALAVLCHGDPAPLRLVARELTIGDRLGVVPEGVARVPLQQDIEATQKRLRLKPAASQTMLELDLREETDLERSRFLHRLQLLEIPWGERKNTTSGKGTFKELWQLEWKPEFAVAIIDAAHHGNTVAMAASGAVAAKAGPGSHLEALCALLETTLLADLPEASAALLARIAQEAARGDDTLRLARAVPGLARLARYGNVRQTDSAQVVQILDGFIARVQVGFGPAVAGIDDDAAAEWHKTAREFHAALVLLESAWLEEWRAILRRVFESASTHPLLAGAAVKLLFDSGHLEPAEAALILGRALSPGADPAQGAAWLEGFLTGQGAVLIHDARLLPALETWVAALSADAFTAVLPLLRRTFATFSVPERAKIGSLIGRAPTGDATISNARRDDGSLDLDETRVRAALPIVLQLLGRGKGGR
jgi:hypothetical protein